MRFFYAKEIQPLHQLEEDESKHMVRVLRGQIGDVFQLTDGKGRLYEGILSISDKKSCVLKTTLVKEEQRTADQLTLVIAPTKSTDRFEWLLEKAMEYGVSCIQPIWTARSERKTEKEDRWNRILISALKQSNQCWLTELRPAISWSTWLETCPDHGFIAHCLDEEKDHWFDCPIRGVASWIAIGPEGDFSPEEIKQATDKGIRGVSLGNQRLRTETAGLAAIQMHALANRD